MTARKIQTRKQRSKVKEEIPVVERTLEQKAIEIIGLKQAEDMTKEDLLILIDAGSDWQDEAKRVGDCLKDVKDMVKKYAELNNMTETETDRVICKISPSTKTIPGTIKAFVKILVDEGKRHLQNEVLNVKITNAKKYLGEDALKDWLKTETNKFGSVSLKKK